MAESIYYGNKGLFVALETTEGTYVAPAATAFIMTEELTVTPVQRKGDTLNIDTIDAGLVGKEMFATKYTEMSFKVPLNWPSVAPTASTGFLAFSPLLEVCGCVAAAYSAGPPAQLSYVEQTALEQLKTASVSMRVKRTASTQLEKKMAGARGKVGFNWEIGKVPRFSFNLTGSFLALASGASLAPTPGAQLTNLGDAAQAAAVSTATLGGKALCLSKLSIANLFRQKVEWTMFSCGDRAQPVEELAVDMSITCKMPNIDTEWNPDAYVGNEYPLAFTIAQIGGSRNMAFSLPTAQLLDWKPVDLGSEMGCELTLRPTSKMTIVTQ